jgi:quercetin dioxygenase-like cupin family protein
MSIGTVTKRARPQAPEAETIRRELLENDHVLVIESIYPPGGSVPTHTHHSPHVVYVVEGGTLETRAPDGTAEIHEVQPGETLWRKAPQSHSTRNGGDTRVRIVEVEVKGAARTPDLWEATPPLVTSGDRDWIPDPRDPRRSMALLVGDPSKPGPYTVRYRAPAGYSIGLHVHPNEDEQLTVLSGSAHWSSGEAGSGLPAYTLYAGAFAPAPAGTPHRLWTTEECVMQLTGTGPRTYVFLDPADDPRGVTG